MTPRYLVIKEITCQCCQGAGWVDNPLFEPCDLETPHAHEPEETICGECEGNGKLREEVDFFSEFPGLLEAAKP